ncbi:AprI/Inh family metalloprotease inhibitor [Methylobacterium sp. 77]|uniref:AprI/Inh family metalloprotease inhibitor n=1 Tax=Methylobacterium sp. 77 TaxID=1101192 RepID=UPI000360E964|nr:AprI/Inh family metalloprotease inhibitor [Methylobacterium sp. 77]
MIRQMASRSRFLVGLTAFALMAGPATAQGMAQGAPQGAPQTTPASPAVPEAPPAPAVPEVPATPGMSETPAAASPPAAFVETLPQTIEGVPGTWDLSRDGSTRRCVMTLAVQSFDSGRRLSFPAGCRRALPILNEVAAWLFVDGAVRLVDKNVRPILMFKIRDDKRSLMARAENGEVYSLVPLQIVAMAPPPPPGPDGRDSAFQLGRDDPAKAAAPGTETSGTGERPTAGTYALDRYREQDVCRLELKPAEGGASPVRVLDGCRDSGLTTFDPASWQGAPGRLTLVARRGHVVGLVPAGENHWRREPEVGTTFVLRRIEAAPTNGSP